MSENNHYFTMHAQADNREAFLQMLRHVVANLTAGSVEGWHSDDDGVYSYRVWSDADEKPRARMDEADLLSEEMYANLEMEKASRRSQAEQPENLEPLLPLPCCKLNSTDWLGNRLGYCAECGRHTREGDDV